MKSYFSTLTRRQFLQLAGSMAALLTSTFGYSRYIAPQWIKLEEIDLTIPTLPDRLVGKRLVQLSDIHLGTYFSQEQLADAIQQANSLKPDWLIITGDYVTVKHEQRQLLPQKIAELIEPLRLAKMPVYASLGNHDLWSHHTLAIIEALGEGGATVLRNSNAQVSDGLWLAGIDDAWGGNPNLRAAMDGIPSGIPRGIPSAATTLLLAHEPDFIDHVAIHNAPVAVQFSGHSHGGQVRIPTPMAGEDGRFSRALVLPHMSERYPIGLRTVGKHSVYTSRGLGAWPVPIRFNCPPEITLFTLQKSA
jgi:uncharacterized protein